MLNEKIKEKAKNGAEKVKDFWEDYGLFIGYCAVCVAIPVGAIALGRRESKKNCGGMARSTESNVRR